MTAVDPKLYAEALAELRAVPLKHPTPTPKPKPARKATPPAWKPTWLTPCYCSGTRTSYQQHKKRGEEACIASKNAAAAYQRAHRGRPDAIRTPPECGSYGGYQAHVKRGEKPCDRCVEARRERDRAFYAARKQTAA